MNEVLIIMGKYKEVLEKAKTLYNMLSDKGEKSHLEELFPELKELDDNKTWEELFEFIDKASGGYLNSAIPCEKFQEWRKWLVKGQFLNCDIVKYIRRERNKIGFHYQGKEVSWIEIPHDVRKRDYSCYFKEDLDCYPFDVEKLYVQSPFSGISFHYDGHVWGMCARDHGVDILCDSKPMNHITLEQEVSNESGDANNGPVGYGRIIDDWSKEHFNKGKTIYEVMKPDQLNEQEKVNCNTGLEFHEGEWLCANKPNDYAHLVKIIKVVDVFGKERYKVSRDYDSDLDVVECDFIEKNYHLWTIADTREGDVLANDHHILILKELIYDWSSNGTSYSVKAYCGIKPNGNFEIGKDNWSFCGTLHIHPATKEQRDLLFKKMEESGYEFDFEKKELKEIEQKSYGQRKECLGCQFNYAGECEGSCQMKREEQKPVWSEEDETYLDLINTAVKLYYTDDRGKENPWRNELLRWLESLKEKIGG